MHGVCRGPGAAGRTSVRCVTDKRGGSREPPCAFERCYFWVLSPLF